jgi:hypothetical protein
MQLNIRSWLDIQLATHWPIAFVFSQINFFLIHALFYWDTFSFYYCCFSVHRCFITFYCYVCLHSWGVLHRKTKKQWLNTTTREMHSKLQLWEANYRISNANGDVGIWQKANSGVKRIRKEIGLPHGTLHLVLILLSGVVARGWMELEAFCSLFFILRAPKFLFSLLLFLSFLLLHFIAFFFGWWMWVMLKERPYFN